MWSHLEIKLYDAKEVYFSLMYVHLLSKNIKLDVLKVQFTRTAPKFISAVNKSEECAKSILMVWVNLKFSVVRKLQPVEVERCFKRDGTAL